MFMLHAQELLKGQRFQFGANWQSFLNTLDDERIFEAELSLKQILGVDNLENKRFLDIGSGSGLFSLAAKRLGAEVYSFDFDPKSVACAIELKRRYYNKSNSWSIEEGSVLDQQYLESLGKFDIVYSWGVLHHTGNLQKALNNAAIPVKDNGLLCIAIYNDQGILSLFWRTIKKIYCSNIIGRFLISSLLIPFFALQYSLKSLIHYKNPFKIFSKYKQKRGMSIYHDWIDWLGGYPFEVAKPEDIFKMYKSKGYMLDNLITTNKLGCNQFVFKNV